MAKRSEREEESVAQNKVVVGLFLLFGIYSFWFWAIWALFWLTPIGAIVAAATVYSMAVYFHSLIDDSYLRYGSSHLSSTYHSSSYLHTELSGYTLLIVSLLAFGVLRNGTFPSALLLNIPLHHRLLQMSF